MFTKQIGEQKLMKLITDKRITKITDAISTIKALKIVIFIIVSWLIFGSITKIDPYPFLFSSTITNYSGFILTIIILIATKTEENLQKTADKNNKTKSDTSDSIEQINKILDKQNKLILQIAKKLDIDV